MSTLLDRGTTHNEAGACRFGRPRLFGTGVRWHPEVFVANPDAPISAVVERANVGISALYSRYAGKEELLRKLCADALSLVISIVEESLADTPDHWTVFSDFNHKMVDAGTSSLTLARAGKFDPTEELFIMANRSSELMAILFDRTKDVLRPGIDINDVSLIFEQLAAVKLGDPKRSAQLRRRYLAVVLDGLRRGTTGGAPGKPSELDRDTGALGGEQAVMLPVRAQAVALRAAASQRRARVRVPISS